MRLKTACGCSSTSQATCVVLKSLAFALRVCLEGHIHFYIALMSAQILVPLLPPVDVLLCQAALILLFFSLLSLSTTKIPAGITAI